jgi:hypothetical protein
VLKLINLYREVVGNVLCTGEPVNVDVDDRLRGEGEESSLPNCCPVATIAPLAGSPSVVVLLNILATSCKKISTQRRPIGSGANLSIVYISSKNQLIRRKFLRYMFFFLIFHENIVICSPICAVVLSSYAISLFHHIIS